MGFPDFAVDRVSVVAQNRLRAVTTDLGESIDACDPRDLLSPAAWVLSGAPTPLVMLVESELDAAKNDIYFLSLDAPLTPGAAFLLGLAAAARSATGQPTSTDAIAFTAPRLGPAALRPNAIAGADLAFPPLAAPSGDLATVSPIDALRRRVLDLVTYRKGAFTDRPDDGRSLEPKRSYSIAQLAAEADATRASLLREPDVRAVRVAVRTAGSAAYFDIYVTPSFSSEPIIIPSVLVAGGGT